MLGIQINPALKLNLFEKHHAPEMYAVVDKNRDHLRPWLPWVDKTRSVTDTENFIQFTKTLYAGNNGFTAGIWYQNTFVGCIGFHEINWANEKSSLGYWLAKDYNGKGIMTAATRAMLNCAFNDYKLNRIEIRCGTENLKSRAIPEKLGFKLEGVSLQCEKIGDRYIDHAVYGLLRSDWSK